MTTAISKQGIGIWFLALGTCFLFLNPLNLNHEVFPYFLVALIFLKIDLKVIIIGLVIMAVSVVWLLKDSTARSMIDAANLVSMLIGASMFDRLKPPGKLLVVNIFYVFLVSNFVICFLQFISVDFQVFTDSFFSSDYRPSALQTVRARNGGVTGLGPEPAYTSVLVVGLGMIVSAYKTNKVRVVLIVFGSLLLLKSVSGYLYGFIYLSFFLSRNNRLFLPLLFKLWYVVIPAIGLFVYIINAHFDWSGFDRMFGRLIQFIVLFVESGSLLQAESQFGSDRLVGIYLSFYKLILSEYGTGFSPAAALNFLFGTPLISILIAAILISKKGRVISYLIALVFVFIAGPKLFWPIFYFGLFGSERVRHNWKRKFINGNNL